MQSDCGISMKSVTLSEFLSETVLSSLSPSLQEYLLLKQFIALCPTPLNDIVIGSGIVPVSLPGDPFKELVHSSSFVTDSNDSSLSPDVQFPGLPDFSDFCQPASHPEADNIESHESSVIESAGNVLM